MQVTLLGTGCPVVHSGRRGAATMVEGGGARVLVDCGSGATQRLVEAGTKGAALDALLLTHFHTDHLVDFYQLVISSWHQGRDRPWPVHAPRPVLDHIAAIMAAWEPERAQRVGFEQRNSATGLEIEPHEIAGGDRVVIGGMEIEVVEVDHGPVVPAFGFVFRADGQTVVHSGDTARCDALIAAGQGADLLVHEVMIHRDAPPGPHRSAATMDNVASYHTLSSAVGGVARDMGAKALALTHIVPPDADRAALLAEVARDYDGPLIVGEDLMRFDLDARSVVWRDAHLRAL